MTTALDKREDQLTASLWLTYDTLKRLNEVAITYGIDPRLLAQLHDTLGAIDNIRDELTRIAHDTRPA